MAEKNAEQLLGERHDRLAKAIRLEPTDRVPLAVNYDSFAARQRGMTIAELIVDFDVTGQAMLATLETLGDVDAIQIPTLSPIMTSTIWLSRVLLPGKDLPPDSLWQMDERELMTIEDYDRIVDMGWDAWYGNFLQTNVPECLAIAPQFPAALGKWIGEYHRRGFAVLSPGVATIPYEYFCGGRSMKEFMLDLFRLPDKVQAAMDAAMPSLLEGARQMAKMVAPLAMWVGGWRSASEFLSPRLWDRFVWPYYHQIVDAVVAEGATPLLHFDANWNRDLARFREFPRGKCILALDSKTDIFKAKEILGDHMCLLGDVSPRMLSLGTPDEVTAYCRRLVNEVGPTGFILGQGCVLPPEAKLENVRAMVRSVHGDPRGPRA